MACVYVQLRLVRNVPRTGLRTSAGTKLDSPEYTNVGALELSSGPTTSRSKLSHVPIVETTYDVLRLNNFVLIVLIIDPTQCHAYANL